MEARGGLGWSGTLNALSRGNDCAQCRTPSGHGRVEGTLEEAACFERLFSGEVSAVPGMRLSAEGAWVLVGASRWGFRMT